MTATDSLPPMPVIVGVARSGTTLLRLMLDGHPDMCIPPETGFIPAAIKQSLSAADPRAALLRTISQSETWEDFDLSADAFDQTFQLIEPFDSSDGIRAFYRLYAARFGKRRWDDKTPTYGRRLTDVQSALPEAHFIHLIRDGRDVAPSVRNLWFAPGRDIESIAAAWKHDIEHTRRLSRHCRHYLECRYEGLISDPEEELKKNCAVVELDYDPCMLLYFERSGTRLEEVKTRYRPDGTVLITKTERLFNHRFTSLPPDTSRTFRWKREMTEEESRAFEQAA